MLGVLQSVGSRSQTQKHQILPCSWLHQFSPFSLFLCQSQRRSKSSALPHTPLFKLIAKLARVAIFLARNFIFLAWIYRSWAFFLFHTFFLHPTFKEAVAVRINMSLLSQRFILSFHFTSVTVIIDSWFSSMCLNYILELDLSFPNSVASYYLLVCFRPQCWALVLLCLPIFFLKIVLLNFLVLNKLTQNFTSSLDLFWTPGLSLQLPV